MSEQALAIIPARGGSKRIPRKNIRPFEGKPIVAYSIEAALQAGCFADVVVSTDDDEIASIARQYGASVPFTRSSENSNDFAGVDDVAIEVLSRFKSEGRDFPVFCLILPTAPFVTAGRLLQGYKLLQEQDVDAVLPVVRFSYPPQRGLRINSGLVSMLEPKYYDSRSQDLEPVYHDSGQFYWMRSEALFAQRKFFADKTAPLELSEVEVQDIDSEDDWVLAELKYRLQTQRR